MARACVYGGVRECVWGSALVCACVGESVVVLCVVLFWRASKLVSRPTRHLIEPKRKETKVQSMASSEAYFGPSTSARGTGSVGGACSGQEGESGGEEWCEHMGRRDVYGGVVISTNDLLSPVSPDHGRMAVLQGVEA